MDLPGQPHGEKQPMSLELFDSSGPPYAPLAASITMTIPSRCIEALPMAIVRSDGHHLVIDTDFPKADDPHFEALILVTGFDRERFAFDREGCIE